MKGLNWCLLGFDLWGMGDDMACGKPGLETSLKFANGFSVSIEDKSNNVDEKFGNPHLIHPHVQLHWCRQS